MKVGMCILYTFVYWLYAKNNILIVKCCLFYCQKLNFLFSDFSVSSVSAMQKSIDFESYLCYNYEK